MLWALRPDERHEDPHGRGGQCRSCARRSYDRGLTLKRRRRAGIADVRCRRCLHVLPALAYMCPSSVGGKGGKSWGMNIQQYLVVSRRVRLPYGLWIVSLTCKAVGNTCYRPSSSFPISITVWKVWSHSLSSTRQCMFTVLLVVSRLDQKKHARAWIDARVRRGTTTPGASGRR